MFDASSYVLGPCLYCCSSLVLFWALFVAMGGFLMAVSSIHIQMACLLKTMLEQSEVKSEEH